ncbi:hypothetical protein L914_07167 [Phytophthora nicotianae]|uniref:Uncharacterized protein n=1 Tax=Phytophthora nicotianae TaxID=4792 RepID=W2NI06_PHYNI|nr:hypothetical protein L914_07167 [Phytophthora nicotianae]
MIKTADVEEQRDVVEIGKQLSRAFVQGRKKAIVFRCSGPCYLLPLYLTGSWGRIVMPCALGAHAAGSASLPQAYTSKNLR